MFRPRRPQARPRTRALAALPASRPPLALTLLALALTLSLLLALPTAGCRRQATPPPAPPAGSAPSPAPAQPPRIVTVRLEPDCAQTGGFYNVEPGPLTVTLEVVGATAVSFGLSPTGTEQEPQPAGTASLIPGAMGPGGGQMWRLTWTVPDEDVLLHMTITARNGAGQTSEIIGLYHEAAASGPEGAPVGGREPLCLDRGVAGRFTIRWLDSAPKRFVAQSWLDESHLLGATGTNPVVLNVDDGSWRALNINAWWYKPDPAGQRLAYANEGGLFVTGTAGSADPGRLLVPAPPTDALWSPDGMRLLYWETGEWSITPYVVAASGGQPRQLPVQAEGYLLCEPVAWADGDTIAFNLRASRSLTGQQEYRSIGYRGDIAAYNLQTSQLRFLTSNPDGTFWTALGLHPDGRLLFCAGEPGRPPQGFGLLSLDGKSEMLGTDPAAEAVSFAPGGQRWLERCSMATATAPPNTSARLVWHQGGATQPWGTVFYADTLAGPLWSPSGRRLAFSLDAYGQVTSTSGEQVSYCTWAVEERE